jgi:3-isopropylmalate/(R)-2-methylmalate dehydratase small subunit
VLVTRANFGCGSSREHAPWALFDYGIRVILAPSFAEIFYGNCFKNGILPVVLADCDIDRLFRDVATTQGYSVNVDLPSQTIHLPDGDTIRFSVDASRKRRLLEGLDDIALTLEHADEIRAYEIRRKQQEPWIFK